MKKQRIMLMSGFLGSGKTTSMTSLAKYLIANGKKAALITNDLGENLVDTSYVANKEVDVQEISNGCLCHDVPQLLEKISILRKHSELDIVMFEPVGSCVDMVDHVYKEVKGKFDDQYILAPVSAIVDPIRYQEVYLRGNEGNGRGEQAASYGFKKQLEEADLLLLNKIDLLTEEEIEAIEKDMEERFPGLPVIRISGLKGTNMDQWADYVLNNESSIRKLDIDMDYYLEGNKDFGWFNKVCSIKASDETDAREICEAYVSRIQSVFADRGLEMLHLKVSLEAGSVYVKTALTGTKGTILTTGETGTVKGEGKINVNIRAIVQPDVLAKIMENSLKEVLGEFGIVITDNLIQSFVPVDAPPMPSATVWFLKRVPTVRDAGLNAFSCDYAVDLDQALTDAEGKLVIFGNMDPAGKVLMGTPEEVYEEACGRIKTAAGRGFILAPGCDLGSAAPIENVKMMRKACEDMK